MAPFWFDEVRDPITRAPSFFVGDTRYALPASSRSQGEGSLSSLIPNSFLFLHFCPTSYHLSFVFWDLEDDTSEYFREIPIALLSWRYILIGTSNGLNSFDGAFRAAVRI